MNKKFIGGIIIFILSLLISCSLFLFPEDNNDDYQYKELTIIPITNDIRVGNEIFFSVGNSTGIKYEWFVENKTIKTNILAYTFYESGKQIIEVSSHNGEIYGYGNLTFYVKNHDISASEGGGPIVDVSIIRTEVRNVSLVGDSEPYYPKINMNFYLEKFVGEITIRVKSLFVESDGGKTYYYDITNHIPQDISINDQISAERILGSHLNETYDLSFEFIIMNGACESWSIFGEIQY